MASLSRRDLTTCFARGSTLKADLRSREVKTVLLRLYPLHCFWCEVKAARLSPFLQLCPLTPTPLSHHHPNPHVQTRPSQACSPHDCHLHLPLPPQCCQLCSCHHKSRLGICSVSLFNHLLKWLFLWTVFLFSITY